MKQSKAGEKVTILVTDVAESKTKASKSKASGDALKRILNEKEEVRRTLRLPSKLSALADARAKDLDMSVNSYIKQLIRKDLEDNQIL